MVERASLLLCALELLTVLALVHLRMVQLLNSSVTLVAFEAMRAGAHVLLILHMLAVFGTVVEEDGRTSEVAHVMRVDAVF